MKRYAIILAVFVVGAVVVACAGELPQGVGGEIGVLDATATPTPTPVVVCDTGENQFGAGYLRCWNFEGERVGTNACGLGLSGIGDVSTYTVVLVSPDENMSVSDVAMFVGEDAGSAAAVWVEVYTNTVPGVLGTPIAVSTPEAIPAVLTDPGDYNTYDPPVSFTFSPTLELAMGTDYLFLATTNNSDEFSVGGNTTYGATGFGYCESYPTFPAWVNDDNFTCTAWPSECSYRCARDTSGDPWECVLASRLTAPIALYGDAATPTATPTPDLTATAQAGATQTAQAGATQTVNSSATETAIAQQTPRPAGVYVIEVLSSQGPTNTPRPTRTPTPTATTAP